MAGGVLGNQVGGGSGRTAATAVGAGLGSVIASDCKVTTGTAVGGVLGGVVGAQMGKGRGKDGMAGIGAAVGAWLGSDCAAGAHAASPVALVGAPFRFNGLTLTPMSGFPIEAFRGVPPIVTTADLQAAREAVRRLSASAATSYRNGDVESALLRMYWAKRIGAVALSVSGSSLTAISGVKVKGETVTASIPAKTLVVLPAFDQMDPEEIGPLAINSGHQYSVGQLNWRAGVQVADADMSSFLNVAGKLLGGANGQMVGALPGPAPVAPGRANEGVPADFLGMPMGRVFRLDSGAMVMKSLDSLTIYNPGGEAVTLPLEKLDFIPRVPVPSAKRQAAADLMKTMKENMTAWTFGEYQRRVMRFWTNFRVPDLVVDLDRGSKTVAYVDSYGNVNERRSDGEASYRTNPTYRLSTDLLAAVSAKMNSSGMACRREQLNSYSKLSGQYANTLKFVCFKGRYGNGAEQQVHTKTYWIGEDGNAVQTMNSLMQDRAIRETMQSALAGGEAADAFIGFIPVAGNLESAHQCVGAVTLAQHAAVQKATGGSFSAFAAARLAGWTEEPAEWNIERVANCVGAIPLGNTVIAAGKGLVSMGGRVLEATPNLDRMRSIFQAFDSPTSIRDFVGGVRNVEELVPGNPLAASFVKSVYDGLMTGQNFAQVLNQF